MAGPVWGTAEIQITADGTILPSQIKRIATQAGDEAGTSMGKSFNKGFDKETKKTFGTKFKGFFRDLNKELQKNSGGWKDLSHNTRQWTLIIGAVASALPSLTALVSAAGVGILALGSAVGSLAIGLGVTIGVFKRFTGDLEDVPADTRAARKEFDKFTKALGDLNGELTSAAFKDTGDAWKSLTQTVKNLKGPLESVARVVGGLVNSFAEWAAVNTGKISTFIENSAGVFDSLARSAGKFGDAFLTAFTNPAMVKAVEGLTGWINDLAESFSNFVESPAFGKWVDQGVSVFEHLGGLLEGIGNALSGLFDKQTTDNLNDFIDGLTDFFNGPGKSLIDFLDQLDIPGVVVDTLNNLGNALKPILDFATDFMKAHPKEVADALTALATAFLLFKGGTIILGASSALGGFFGAIKKGKVSNITKLAGAIGGLTLAFQGLSDQNATNGGAGLSAIGGALTGASLGGPIGALVGTLAGLLASMIEDVFLTPDVEGAWQKGWSQIFNMDDTSGAGLGQVKQFFKDFDEDILIPFYTETVPNFFTGLGEKFATGWDQITGFFDTVKGKFENGWQQIVDFFTISVPGFFEMIGQWFADGWTNVSSWFDSTFVQPIKTAWEGFIAFWTIEVPGFFATVGKWFQDGWNSLVKWFDTSFVQPVKNAWNGFVNFWTVEVPAWFSRMASSFQAGLARLAAPFSSFFGDVQANWNNFWNGLGRAAENAWNTVRSTVDRIVSKIREIASNPFGAIGNLLSGRGFAAGGVLTGPQRILAGEAGPEAIVPLNRALSQVDPSVRWLSAIAQGKGMPSMANGGTVGGGRVLNVAAGAIQVIGSPDPQRTALAVVNRMVERAV